MEPAGCVFCGIVQGVAPASMVYADHLVVAFMDIRPVNTGHVLVVPRFHASCIAELDSETGGHIFQVGMKLGGALRRSGVPCEGVNLYLADGKAAGQEVPHVHLHVVPRFRGDGFGFHFRPDYFSLPARDTLEEVAARIRQSLEA
jgi:histidine triad (HIT) family protein